MNITNSDNYKSYKGEVHITVRDRQGNIVDHYTERNAIKIFAKEILSHRMHYQKVWSPNANGGNGAWTDLDTAILNEFAPKYILLGASFDDTGEPLDVNDSRYYDYESTTNSYIPKRPLVGADNQGDLINPIPIAEPNRPLKRIESVEYSASYQPADTPLLDDTVRAVNNVVMLTTTLKTNEYNGLEGSSSDFFTITEIALAGGVELSSVGACELNPKVLFLQGVNGDNDTPILCTANGSNIITIDNSVNLTDVNRIKEGDQIYIVSTDSTGTGSITFDELGQVQPYYLVTSKSSGGRDIVLDRTPESGSGPLTGDIGIYRSSLRLFSQRILTRPFKKTPDLEVTIKWVIYFA